jgi:hypothetical protein
VTLEDPRSTFLARGVSLEQPLDDLAVRADEGIRREVDEKRARLPDVGIGCERVVHLDLEAARRGEQTHRLEAAPVGTRDDPRDSEWLEPDDELTGVCSTSSVERTLALELRRVETFACAGVS